ncbi:uncharacterized protein LOC114302865 [Camellia sinensis]|uniref:uncharacterized protein LOC114302865 n=1 Tax=Camellia sinensis TaxID=4442 RepID=UPI001036CBD8|nr:uncharacterized protein LOC114302865 [Camellia sinensis]
MLRVEDEGLRVSLATFQLTGDANYWWKYVKGTVGATWVVFTKAFLAKYFPSSARERLREQFVELRQGVISLAQFEMRFTSLSRFAPELVATEEHRCYEFERQLRDDIQEKVVGSMWKNYFALVEAAAHVEAMVSSVGRVREEAISVTPTVHKHSRLSKRWRRAHTHSQSQSLSLSRVSDLSFAGPSEVWAPSQVQNWETTVCFDCGQQGHVRRFFSFRTSSLEVSEPSQTLSHQPNQGRYQYQTRRGQASRTLQRSACQSAQ